MNDTTHTERRQPLRFVLAGGYGDGCICCPVCGGDYVHLGPVTVMQGQTQTVVERERTSVTACDRGQRCRGSLVQVCFLGECGHAFAYSFSFHKGITSCELTAQDVGPCDPQPTLWRD